MSTESIPTIDTESLDEVTGGADATTDQQAQITTLLQSIQSSIKNLGSNNNNSSNSFAQLLPFMLLMRGSGGFGGGGGSCGCGMPGCGRCYR